MARKSRTYRHFSWNYFIIQMVIIAGAALLLWRTNQFPTLYNSTLTVPLIFAFAGYYAWYSVSRALLLVHHQRGMKFFRQKHYQGAIKAFELSQQYLNAHPWIDKYRWIVLLSSSALSYREMAMFNIGAAYVYLENAKEARKAFEAFLKAFPASSLANTVRKLMLTLEAPKKKK